MPPGPPARPRPRAPRPASSQAPASVGAGARRNVACSKEKAGLPPTAPGAAARSRLPLVLGAATGILFCALALAVLFVVNSHASSPEATGQSLCADLQAQNYDAVYNLLAPPLQSAGNATQFAASQRELDALSGKVVSCAVTVQQAGSTQASLRLAITRQQTGAAQATVHMQLLDGVWRVDTYDTSVV